MRNTDLKWRSWVMVKMFRYLILILQKENKQIFIDAILKVIIFLIQKELYYGDP